MNDDGTLTADDLYRTLAKVRALVDDKKTWTSQAHARRADGNIVGPLDRRACRWCLLGAIYKTLGTDNYSDPRVEQVAAAIVAHLPRRFLMRDEWRRPGKVDLFVWNDQGGRLHHEVTELLDRVLVGMVAGEKIG